MYICTPTVIRGNVNKTNLDSAVLCSYQVVIKSLVSWEILSIKAYPQMPLANNGSVVISLLDILCYCGLIPGQACGRKYSWFVVLQWNKSTNFITVYVYTYVGLILRTSTDHV